MHCFKIGMNGGFATVMPPTETYSKKLCKDTNAEQLKKARF